MLYKKQREVHFNKTDIDLLWNIWFALPDDDVEDCEQETGSPCTAGGLHMPNSRSMNELAKRVRRFRYYSQCADTEHKKISTGSSPGKGELLLLIGVVLGIFQ